MITIDGINVTAAVAGTINIQHNKNMISTFSFTLKDDTYSPLTNTHIKANKEVVITCYLNGYEIKLFTGLIDDISVDYTLNNFSINISGSDYGKKLRNKRMSLISVQDKAVNKYRGSLVKYMAAQAGVTNVDAPAGSYTRIDHSFEDQSILDMINKELVIDSYWWRFDEEGVLKIQLDEIKTDTVLYPTADWTYGESRAMRYGFTGTDENIINKVKILGTVYETAIEVDNPEDSPYNQYVVPPPAGYTSTQLCNFQNSFGSGVDATAWSAIDSGFTLTVDNYGTVWGTPPIKVEYLQFRIDWSSVQNYIINDFSYAIDGMAEIKDVFFNINYTYAFINVKRLWDGSALGAFTISMTLEGKEKETQTTPQEDPPTSAIIDGEEIDSPTYEYSYDQVGVEIIDATSIAEYGERKPNTEGTIEFPLAENKDQCEGIGRKIVKDSHRYTKQPDFIVPFNPLLKVGQTIALTDKKIGFSERWYVEEVIHTIEGSKARTQVGCVYYA